MALFLLTTDFWPKSLVSTDFRDEEFKDNAQKNPKYTDFCENCFTDY